jgi:phage-related holin
MKHFLNETKPVLLLTFAAIGGLFSEVVEYFIANQFQFLAIAIVVIGDAVIGMTKAIINNDFQITKALKSVYVFVAFTALLAVCLVIEKGFPYANWISEAVMLPIIVFLLVSILKSLNQLGLINTGLLNSILEKVDKHKNEEVALVNDKEPVIEE